MFIGYKGLLDLKFIVKNSFGKKLLVNCLKVI